MLLASRARPPSALKLGGPSRYLSVKRFLPATPLPSPSLPSILPRHGKKPPKLNSQRILRALSWLTLIITLYYLLAPRTRDQGPLDAVAFPSATELVEAPDLPPHATALSLTDGRGQHRWTVSIPAHLEFPLAAADYADICADAAAVAQHAAGGPAVPGGPNYYAHDHHFIDVDDAQSRGLLPRGVDRAHSEDEMPACKSSLTYVLDDTDAGLGSALLGMWLSYGLAQHEGRAFFLDDTNFPYGRYEAFFRTSPHLRPSCRPPPKTHRIPCPRQARHLVVSAATAEWIFGDRFHRHFTPRQIFDLARHGYEALFMLQENDDGYVRDRVAKLRVGGDGVEHGLVGIHIRRGDRHPFEFAYRQGYLPPATYMAAAQKLVGQSESWTLVLASDDADVYDHGELSGAVRAQTRISLASKKQLASGLGWEGGFFKDVFWGLGLPLHVQHQRRIGSPSPTKARESSGLAPTGQSVSSYEQAAAYRTRPTKEAAELRQLLGRAYLLDLAVLAQSDKVVCGASSNACRILAVMLGWDRAFEKKDWTNVDGHYGWRAMDY